jgi:dipeptidyl aminopeptidase/acylaminoacyl peptidase
MLWDVDSESMVKILSGYERFPGILDAVFSPGGSIIMIAQAASIVLWDITKQIVIDELPRQISLPMSMSGRLAIAFAGRAQQAATSPDERTVQIWDIADKKLLANLGGHSGNITAIRFSPVGDYVATASLDTTARIWNLAAERAAILEVLPGSAISHARFSPNGKRAVTGHDDGSIRIWDVTQREASVTPGEGFEWIASLAFSPDGKHIAVGSYDRVCLYNIEQKRIFAELQANRQIGEVRALCFSPDSARLATGSSDETVRLWNVDRYNEPITLYRHHGDVRAVAFTSDGARLVTGATDGAICIF